MTSTPASFASDFEVHANPGASTAIPSTSAGHGSLYTALFAKPGSRSQSGAVTPGSDVADKGRHYMLTADDEEIRRILQTRLDREAAGKAPLHAGIRLRDLVFTKRFTTFDRQNPLSAESPFHGFFTLFWLAIALLLLRVAAQNWRLYGSFLGKAEILHIMFDRDIVVLGLTDAVMVASTVVAYGLQKLIQHGYLSWRRSGWIIQNVWQSFFLGATIAWTLYREWPWTHTIFIVLHCLVFVMKQHSYAFYNGYLSQLSRRYRLLKEKLKELQEMECAEPEQLPVDAIGNPGYPPTEDTGRLNITHRPNLGTRLRSNPESEPSRIGAVMSAVDDASTVDQREIQVFTKAIQSELETLTEELNGNTKDPMRRYPHNLTLANWADYTTLPTLVYEFEYSRQERINWWYVAEKTTATLGVIWVMIVISQSYIYPRVTETMRMKAAGMSLQERWKEFPWVVSDLLFPLLLEQLLAWYVIWECTLNVLAELTRFADRNFYGTWWNSVSWDQYARNWNRPVHDFLLRHVYGSSISTFHLSKGMATFVTFLLSACVHELVMLCLFKKVRGYLFVMQLLQLPLASLSRTKLLRGRQTLGNLLFWFGLFVGPSILTSLYLVV